MKTSFKIILGLLISTIFVTSCSRKNPTFINRNFHAVATEYNTLYNGGLAFEKGRITLNQSYQDNYWDVLPIERMQVDDEVLLPGQTKNQDFERSEEKAVKAIQKHSMNVKGREHNPQIDEAYLLLGQSRYFDQRFVPALQAFNYILYKYPSSDKINQAKVWREKTNIRLENDDLAILNLKRLLEQEDLKGQELADATSMLAQAYINIKSIDSALTQIEIAANVTKNNDELGRYRFIQGQLYNKTGDKDSANIAFDKVIDLNRKTPRIYLVTAHLEKAKNFDYKNGNKLDFLELLTDLEENRENRPYLDKIYHQIAEYHLNNESDSLAVAYFNKSLRTNSPDKLLNAKNYEILGDMSFDNSEYKIAGAYFDSTMLNLEKDRKPFRILKKKRDNLDDVIYYEDIAKANDSILRLIDLTTEERLAYFDAFIENLKLEAEKAKEQKIATENQKAFSGSNDKTGGAKSSLKEGQESKTNAGSQSASAFGNRPGVPGAASVFYFYNPTIVAYGRNAFSKTWGERTLEDNWRWSSTVKSSIKNQETKDVLAEATKDELYDPEYYISKIPTEQKQIDSIIKARNYAYYQLGIIYKEKFKEYQLAKDKLQQLLKNNPEERLILPTKYNLYKIYTLLGENDEATIAKNEIIQTYPDSRYAAILNNPELAAANDENSPESLYENLYAKLQTQEYVEIISKSENYINVFEGEPIAPKFELLKATATGRLYGFEAYSNAMNYVALNYANTPEGKQAQNISSNVLASLANKEFVSDSIGDNYKVIYLFSNTTPEDIGKFHKTLNEVIEPIQFYKLSTSIDVYDPTTTLVLVHGLKSKQGAQGFTHILKEKDRGKIAKTYTAISSENYQIIQIHKNLDMYLKDQQ